MCELKPCPFCGGKANLVKDELYKGFYVTCDNYDCFIEVKTNSYHYKRLAISEWNRRVSNV